MDYDKLRTYIIGRILETTEAWNAREEIYPVRPPTLTEAQSALFTMCVEKTISNQSDQQNKVLRDVMSEILGTKMPVFQVKEISDIDAYVCLTSKTGEELREICPQNRAVMKKLSGTWVNAAGKTSSRSSLVSNNWRISTVEEIATLVNNVPDAQLTLGFSGLLNYPSSGTTFASIVKEISERSGTMYLQKPNAGVDEQTKELYRRSSDAPTEYVKYIFGLLEKEYSDDVANQVYNQDNGQAEVEPITCYLYKGKPALFISASAQLTPTGVVQIPTITWGNVEQADEKAITKVVKTIPLSFLVPYCSKDLREALTAEVSLD